ncbi:hypothetical protein HL667_10905 [Bradyrhizobium sp. 83012]|uniref:Uncharacterized protein n=1 Tax=Bradyrhizobium aeschynomenes TaxID=2734909 RepID=A0ABX2CCF4_9BRAD|nr:hypothetical protein [Bradyrhizobium aeschynomenes]
MISDPREKPFTGQRFEMNVGWQFMVTTEVLDQFDGLDLVRGRNIDDDVEIAVERQPLLRNRPENDEAAAAALREGFQLGHDSGCRQPPPCGLARLAFRYCDDTGHGSS